MAFDGITTRALVDEIRKTCAGSRIEKIYQPERDEVILSFRTPAGQKRLLLSAHADGAGFYLTQQKPETPLTPPMFCMLFRKEFGSGRLVDIHQVGFDRIIELEMEVYNELSDLVRRKIILEIMGRHSNLILVDEEGKIIDSIHHVGADMSSFRTVLPGQPYRAPSHNHKADPLEVREESDFYPVMEEASAMPLSKAFYTVFNGISPMITQEMLYQAGVDERSSWNDQDEAGRKAILAAFTDLFDQVREEKFVPSAWKEADRFVEYAMVDCPGMTGGAIVLDKKKKNADEVFMGSREVVRYETPSELLDHYYVAADKKNRIRQKAQDLRHLVMTHYERATRKLQLQSQQMKDTEGREKYQHLGDLIISNLYQIKPGAVKVVLDDYYVDPPEKVEVTLQNNLTPSQNAQKFYNRYNKLKRTAAALTTQMADTQSEIDYLEEILNSMEMADCEQDLEDIRLELVETGYARRSSQTKKKNLAKSKPLEETTSEGVKILIGKNNIQNDQLTFKTAFPMDLWFHVKDYPGSHTILFVSELEEGKDYTDQSILEAAQAAARHCRAKNTRVCVDYTLRKFVRKPAGSKPGFVIYTHQKSIFVDV